MKAIRVSQHGGPDVLRTSTVPLPTLQPGYSVVKVSAAGVNFYDIYRRRGDYGGALPYVPGIEAVGAVIDSSPLCRGGRTPEKGARVAWVNQPGAYAPLALIANDRLIEIPSSLTSRLDDVRVASHLLQGMTAEYLTTQTAALDANQSVLIHAAGGVTGGLLVQRAVSLGARVIATASTPHKASLAYAAGAHKVVDYSSNVSEEVREWSSGKGVDVVYDGVGGPTFNSSLASLRPRGLLVIFGQAGGPVPLIDVQRLNAAGSISLVRPNLDDYIITRNELQSLSLRVLRMIADKELTTSNTHQLSLEQAPVAHRAMEERTASGKYVLIPDPGL